MFTCLSSTATALTVATFDGVHIALSCITSIFKFVCVQVLIKFQIWFCLCCAGLENHDSGVGIYAPDAEAYSVFADLFDPIIEDYHGGFKKTDKHPPKDWGDVDTLGNLDPAVSVGLFCYSL